MTQTVARHLPVLGLVLLFVAAGRGSLSAQDRDSIIARAFNEFDSTRQVQMLIGAMRPSLGPPHGKWADGVQLLAQTLLEGGNDSVAQVWLRWATRLSPNLQPDTVQFLPAVVAACRSARGFVAHTSGLGDSAVVTTWFWPAQPTGARMGQLQVAPASAVAAQFEMRGGGPLGAGGTITLAPGSYEVRAAAPGYDTVRVTREVLPGITTVLEFHLRPRATAVHTPPPPPPPAPSEKKGFPIAIVAGVAGVAVIGYVLLGGHGSGPPTPQQTPSTGGISVTVPNP